VLGEIEEEAEELGEREAEGLIEDEGEIEALVALTQSFAARK
jgi:hypothetical protein